MSRVIVIGGGAAGLIASWRAASLGAEVTLLEKTSRLGTKILISGGGKCNITHAGETEEVLAAFRPNERKFLRPSFYAFGSQDVLKLVQHNGLKVYTRPDGRVFPVDGTARDVVDSLVSHVRRSRVRIRLDSPVLGIEKTEPGKFSVKTAQESFQGKVIVAVGGSSYPKTGSTGDGWEWAKRAGHTIVPVRAALAPMDVTGASTNADWRPGVALRDVTLSARQGKVFACWRGDLLFSHHGVSGPCALGVSRDVDERLGDKVGLEVDLEPDLPQSSIAQSIMSWARKNPRKHVINLTIERLPNSLGALFASSLGQDRHRLGQELSEKTCFRLAERVKNWQIGSVAHVPLEKGEVVAGGVSLEEVDYQTMGSHLMDGLYFCGEVLDIAGPVGGYNLQAAFSTGFVAGTSAANPSPKS